MQILCLELKAMVLNFTRYFSFNFGNNLCFFPGKDTVILLAKTLTPNPDDTSKTLKSKEKWPTVLQCYP